MNRRKFIAVLAGLPVIGKYFGKPEETIFAKNAGLVIPESWDRYMREAATRSPADGITYYSYLVPPDSKGTINLDDYRLKTKR